MGTEKSPYCNCLYYSANALSRLMTRMADEEFALAGVSSSYAFLLMTVNGQPGIQPKEISQKMQLTPSTVTRLVEKMEARALLERLVALGLGAADFEPEQALVDGTTPHAVERVLGVLADGCGLAMRESADLDRTAGRAAQLSGFSRQSGS